MGKRGQAVRGEGSIDLGLILFRQKSTMQPPDCNQGPKLYQQKIDGLLLRVLQSMS